MNHRRLIWVRRHREQMDKSNVTGKCRNHLWCAIFSSIAIWLFLFYFHFSDLISSKNVIRSLQNEYSIAVSREPNSLHVTENDAETSTRPNLTENRVEPVIGDEINVQLQRKEQESLVQLRDTGNETESSNIRIIAGDGQELSEETEPENGPPVTETEEKVELIHDPAITKRRTESDGDDSAVEDRVELVDQPSNITAQRFKPNSNSNSNSDSDSDSEPNKIRSAVNRLKPTSDDDEEEIPHVADLVNTPPFNETGDEYFGRPSAREEKEEPVPDHNSSDAENRVEPVHRLSSKPSSVKEKTEPVNLQSEVENQSKQRSDICSGRYVYVHHLPRRFNVDILRECRKISRWTDMCRFTTNMGLGPPIGNSKGIFSNTGWYATNQFALDVIFSNRMKKYKCLTNDSSMASAIFVPFYAGFDISRHLWGFNTSVRDANSLALLKWLTARPEWKVLAGRDHFLVAGRMSWDFRRLTDEESDWGNKLLQLKEAKNMTALVIESSPWTGNDFAIPYPTYFHPSRDIEVFQWQNRMRRLKRRYLFSFAGGPRPNLSGSIRGQIIDQCQALRRKCKMLECVAKSSKCDNPGNVMRIFQSSVFCLQPPGDSYTRRSAFDSMLAGCIPVFFHPGSAYVQYIWHLPKNYTTYSVLISEIEVRRGNVNIEKRLLQIPTEQVTAMREEVIKLIPKVIYADPKSRLGTLEDAFDLAVQGVIRRVDRARKAIRDGMDPDAGYAEANSWKYNLFGTEAQHEWDPFFSKQRKGISH